MQMSVANLVNEFLETSFLWTSSKNAYRWNAQMGTEQHRTDTDGNGTDTERIRNGYRMDMERIQNGNGNGNVYGMETECVQSSVPC